MVKNEGLQLVRCLDCENAVLLRYYKNPIIAVCKAKGGDRDVAEIPKLCRLFLKATKPISIEPRKYND